MIKMPPSRPKGFSLIELMIALVLGLIVIGGVLAFTMSSLRSNADFVQSTRLTQELRSSIDFISRDLRRAGYDENAMNYYTQGSTGVTTVSPFTLLRVEPDADGDCVLYAYDRGAPGAGGQLKLADGEIRGIRLRTRVVNGLNVGVLEVAESAAAVTPACGGGQPDFTKYPTACNAGSGWCALSDPRVLDVDAFVVDTSGSINVASVPKGLPFSIRDLQVTLTGSLIGNTPAVSRTTLTRVRVRADCMRLPGEDPAILCNSAPSGT